MTHDPIEYMRAYRAAGRDVSSKVQTKARSKALTWVRRNRPDIWETCLAEAKQEVAAAINTKENTNP